MTSPKPYVSVCEESSVVQVLDSIEPLVTASSSTPSSSSARVMDSIEPLVPTVQSIVDEPVAGPSAIASGSGGSQPAIATSLDEDEFVTMPEFRPTGSSDDLRSVWNWRKIFSKLGTLDQCVQFAEERGMIPTKKICSYHHKPMKIYRDAGQFGRFRCRKNCRTSIVSRTIGTWFEAVRLPLPLMFQIMYAFCEGLSYHQTIKELAYEDSSVLSQITVTDWFHYCREVVAVHEIQNQRAQGKIGGPNKLVQIDKSKFGKKKYNRGRKIDPHWVIGMIEDGNDDLRLEVCPDNERSSEILVPLVKKHVAEGSIILTDTWRPYMSLSDHGYTHRKINHSDPINKVAPDGHTERIENQWSCLKKYFRQGQNKQDFTIWLGEYSWRRRIYNNHLDAYEELLKAIKYIYSK